MVGFPNKDLSDCQYIFFTKKKKNQSPECKLNLSNNRLTEQEIQLLKTRGTVLCEKLSPQQEKQSKVLLILSEEIVHEQHQDETLLCLNMT